MRLLSLTLLALTLHCAEETKLPADAQAAVDKADKAISVIQAKADAEIGKIRQGLIVTLTKSQVAVTKKGDLDGANAVKAKIDALEKMLPDLLDIDKKPDDDWTAIKGKEMRVDMTGLIASGITIKDGETWVMYPNPTDKWGREAMFDFRGNTEQPNWAGSAFNGYALVWMTDTSKGVDSTIKGSGPIRFRVNLGSFGGSGSIRVKLVKQ